MKRMMEALAVSVTLFLLASAPTLATMSQELGQEERDECLLLSKNCLNAVDDIYQRMHRLDKEIKKGTRVYTPAELKRLQQKLIEVDQMLRELVEE